MLNAIPEAIRTKLTQELGPELRDFTFSGGGCINSGGQLTTSKGEFFLKWNDAKKFPGMFAAEANGLRTLRDTHCIFIPAVVLCGEISQYQFIVLEFIVSARKSEDYWETLGTALAGLHRNSAAMYGLDHDNYIGSLTQSNTRHEDWVEFFVTARLQPQLKLATESGLVTHRLIQQFDSLFTRLNDLLVIEKPALLHGDLWSGNLITNAKGNPCLIDPAVYYGNREIDLAFTTLFGGFSADFYTSYNETFPLENGYQDRFALYNLYPLLVHVNLFGASYLGQVVSILNRFV